VAVGFWNRFWSRGEPETTRLARCPLCDAPIESDCMNIGEGVALCPGCGVLSRLSEVNRTVRSTAEILADPPHGCDVVERGRGVAVRASLRSIGGAAGALGMALFWNGGLSIFIAQAIAAVVYNVSGPLPPWFRAPDLVNGVPHMNGQPMGIGETVFLCLFLTPFVAIGIGFAITFLLLIAGRIEVVVDEHDSHVAIGIGPLAWRRRFDPHAAERVGTGKALMSCQTTEDAPPPETIELRADRTIRFGTLLPPERAEWMRAAIRALLLDPDRKRHHPALPVVDWIKPA